MGMLAFPVNLVGMNDVFNPFSKEYVPFIIEGAKYKIPSQVNIQGQEWVAVNIGYVQLSSTLPTEYQIEVLDTNGITVLETLTLQEQIVGNDIQIAKNQCIWFNENGLRGNYYIHSDWLDKILHIKRGFYIGTAVSSIRLGASNIHPWFIQFSKTDGSFDDNEAPYNWYKKMYGIDTTWELMFNTESVYFRTEGSKSNLKRVDGIQPYGMKNLTGSVSTGAEYNMALFRSSSGVFSLSHTDSKANLSYGTNTHYYFMNLNTNKQMNEYSDDIVVSNRLIRVYHLLSINGVNISDIIGE